MFRVCCFGIWGTCFLLPHGFFLKVPGVFDPHPGGDKRKDSFTSDGGASVGDFEWLLCLSSFWLSTFFLTMFFFSKAFSIIFW